MKTKINAIFFACIMLFALGQTMAQSPDAFNYQAVARDAAGSVLADQALGIRVSLHNGSASGPVDYSEIFAPTTNEFGLFTLAIGTGTIVSGDFSTLSWGTAQYWLQVEMDPTGGVSYTDMGTSQLLSVPYAMYAENTNAVPAGSLGYTLRHNGTGWVADTTIYNNGTNVGIGTSTPSHKLDVVHSGSTGILVKSTAGFSVMDIDAKSGDAALRFMKDGATQWNLRNQPGTDNFEFYEMGSGSRMVIEDSTGHIGIGTLTPISQSKMHVASNNRYAGYFTSDSSSSLTHVIHAEYNAAGNDGRAVYGKATPADYYGYGGYFEGGYKGIYSFCSGTSGGYMGVHGYASTSGTGGAYGVYGYASASTGTPYGVYCSGSGGYTGTWSAVSDAKFKKDIINYDGALENIMKLRPVSYSMKTDEYPFMGFASGTQIGFISQEVKEVFPTLVEKGVHPGAEKEDAAVEYLGMNYIGLVPVLVSGMQEQQQQIELLKQQVELLKQEVELLKNK